MRGLVSYIRRLGRLAPVLIIGILATFGPSKSIAADGPIADPKKWCGDVAGMIADGAVDKFFDAFRFATGGLVDRPTIAQGFASLQPSLAREGAARSHDFIREIDYEQAFTRIWYLLQFDRGFLFLRCEAARFGNAWIITEFTYADDAEKIGLP